MTGRVRTVTASIVAGVIVVFGTIGCTAAGEQSDEGAAPPVPSVAPPTVAADDLVGLDDPLFPRQGNPGYDVENYDWDLRVDPAPTRWRRPSL